MVRALRGPAVVRRNGPTAEIAGSKICGVSTEREPARPNLLLAVLILHMAASLWHHIHNGQFADEYPNLPGGFPVWIAYVAWGVTTALGLAGFYAVCNGRPLLGLGAMGLYASYGLLAFAHYKLAPMSAHTLVQNATILSEGLTALLLLGTVIVLLVRMKEA